MIDWKDRYKISHHEGVPHSIEDTSIEGGLNTLNHLLTHHPEEMAGMFNEIVSRSGADVQISEDEVGGLRGFVTSLIDEIKSQGVDHPMVRDMMSMTGDLRPVATLHNHLHSTFDGVAGLHPHIHSKDTGVEIPDTLPPSFSSLHYALPRSVSGTEKPIDRDSCGTPTGLAEHRKNKENWKDCKLCSWVAQSLAYRNTPEGKAAFRDKGTGEWDKFIKNAPHGTADRMEWEIWNRRIYDSRGNMKPDKVEGWLAGKPTGELCLECLERKTRPGYPERGRLAPEKRQESLEKAHQKLREKGEATRQRKEKEKAEKAKAREERRRQKAEEKANTPKKPRGRKPPSEDVLQDEIARGLRHPNGLRKSLAEQRKVLEREEAERQARATISQYEEGDYPGLCGTEAGLKKHKKDHTPLCEKCRTSPLYTNPGDPNGPLISHEVDVRPVLTRFYDALKGFTEGTVSAEDYDNSRKQLKITEDSQRRKLRSYDPTMRRRNKEDSFDLIPKAVVKEEDQEEQNQATARYNQFSSVTRTLLDKFPESGELQGYLDRGAKIVHPKLDVLGKYPVDNNYGVSFAKTVAPAPTKTKAPGGKGRGRGRGREEIQYPDIDESTGLPQGMEKCGPEEWHGTQGGYSNHKCRGAACRWAYTVYMRGVRERRRQRDMENKTSNLNWKERYASEKEAGRVREWAMRRLLRTVLPKSVSKGLAHGAETLLQGGDIGEAGRAALEGAGGAGEVVKRVLDNPHVQQGIQTGIETARGLIHPDGEGASIPTSPCTRCGQVHSGDCDESNLGI